MVSPHHPWFAELCNLHAGQYCYIHLHKHSLGDLLGASEYYIQCDFGLREANPTTGTAYVLTADSADARNSFDTPHAVQLAQRPLAKVGGKFVYSFPPLSATVLELR